MSPSYPLDAVLIAVALAAGIIVLLSKDWVSVLLLQLVLYGHIVCWTYLYWVNRMPERVTKGIYLSEILLLLGICLIRSSAIEWKRKKELGYVGFTVAAILSVILFMSNFSQLENRYEALLERNKEWDACKEYCREHDEQLYFLDTPTFAGLSYVENIFEQDRNLLQNYDLSGGWITNSPVYFDKLEAFGIRGTASEHLSNGGSLYLICSAAYEEAFVRDYFVRDGYNVLIEKADDIFVDTRKVFTVYRIALERK